MRFTATSADLAAAITRAAAGVPSRPLKEVHAQLYVSAERYEGDGHRHPGEADDHVFLTGTDGEVSFRATAQASVDEPGRCLLPGRLLAEISRYFPKSLDVTVETKNRFADITVGRSRFTVPCGSPELFPVSQQPAPGFAVSKGDEFTGALRRVIPAVSRDDINPSLTGVLLYMFHGSDGWLLTLAGGDRYRMAAQSLAVGMSQELTPSSVILPRISAERFARVAGEDVILGWDAKLITMECYELSVISRQLPAGFPAKWGMILQHQGSWVSTDTAELTRAVKLALLASGEDTRIELGFKPGEIRVRAMSADKDCATVLDADGHQGDPVTILLGARMLLDGLARCGPQVRLAFSMTGKPVLLESGTYRYMMQSRVDMPASYERKDDGQS